MGKLIVPNTKEMDEIKSINPSKWSLIKNLSDFIKTLGLENKNVWAPLYKNFSSDLAKVESLDFASWKLLAFNNLENKSMKAKKEVVDKTNDLVKDFQEKEKSWITIKSQDEIIFGTSQYALNEGSKPLKTLVEEITGDSKINYPIIVVQERQKEFLWGFYYNPKNWQSYKNNNVNTIIKFAIPIQTTANKKESGIYIMGIRVELTNLLRKKIHNSADYDSSIYGGFYNTKLGSPEDNPIKIFKVPQPPSFLNWNVSPFELK